METEKEILFVDTNFPFKSTNRALFFCLRLFPIQEDENLNLHPGLCFCQVGLRQVLKVTSKSLANWIGTVS